jgi:hypothetical protein
MHHHHDPDQHLERPLTRQGVGLADDRCLEPVGDPGLRAVAVPFTDQEFQLLSARAAAHGVAAVDFLRICALMLPTAREAVSLVCGADARSSVRADPGEPR